MKALISILFLLNIDVTFSQTVNKDFIFNNVKSEFERIFIEDLCYDYLKLAEQKIQNDSLILPQYKFHPSLTETFKRWVNLKYKIINWNYVHGDLIRPETKCFDEYMFEEIENRFGKGFFESQRKVADSLDKKGLGYIEPLYLESDDSLKKFINKSINIDSLNRERISSKLILFEINENGIVTKSLVFRRISYSESAD